LATAAGPLPPPAMPESVHLTELQLAIVRILWTRGPSTVLEVQEGLLPERPLAQTTVATLLTRLEKRGVVSHANNGRQFTYRAEVTEPQVRRSMVSELADMLFDGRPTALLSHLIDDRDIDAGELDEMKRLIAAAEQRASSDGR
jgi:predicted transcriptional regulator